MMPRKRLGCTDIQTSSFGLGTVKFGRTQGLKYPTPFALPEDAHLRDLLACARDFGVNFLDTAPAYGHSEERLGDLLKKERKDWVISTKVGEEFVPDPFTSDGKSYFDYSASHTRRSVERSLRRLRTDYLDLVLIHSNGEDLDILTQTPVIQTLQQLKQEGWIRAFGMSTKTLEGSLLAAELCDAVMLVYTEDYPDERAAIDKCVQQGAAVLLKKVLGSGHICHDAQPANDPIQAALDFVYAHTGVTSAILGTVNLQHLRDNLIKALRAQHPA